MRRMIRSFRDREAERIFERTVSRKLPRGIQRVAYRKLLQLDAATRVDTLRIPRVFRLEIVWKL